MAKKSTDQLALELIESGCLRVDPEEGKVYSIASNNPNKPIGYKNRKGYLRACLSVNNKRHFIMVHRIVWISENGVPDDPKLHINHKNGDKLDNRITNLELLTNSQNMKHAARNGLTNGGRKNALRDPVTGQFISKKKAGHLLDGREWNQMPEVG